MKHIGYTIQQSFLSPNMLCIYESIPLFWPYRSFALAALSNRFLAIQPNIAQRKNNKKYCTYTGLIKSMHIGAHLGRIWCAEAGLARLLREQRRWSWKSPSRKDRKAALDLGADRVSPTWCPRAEAGPPDRNCFPVTSEQIGPHRRDLHVRKHDRRAGTASARPHRSCRTKRHSTEVTSPKKWSGRPEMGDGEPEERVRQRETSVLGFRRGWEKWGR
jgi:hypothetical protein